MVGEKYGFSKPIWDDDYVSERADRAAIFLSWVGLRGIAHDFNQLVQAWQHMPPPKRSEYRQLAKELFDFMDDAPVDLPKTAKLKPKYYRLSMHNADVGSTYYRKAEGKKMQFFLPETASWRDSVFADPEDYAAQAAYGSMLVVSLADLPKEVLELEGDCE